MKSQRGIDSYAYSSAIFKHMPIGVALFDVHDFRLLTLNPRFESFLEPAWQQGRAIGHSLTEWIPAWVPDTEVHYLLDILQQVKREGVPHQTEERSVTNVEEGTTSYWSWTLEPVYDEIGELVQLLLTENEVTSYVLARQQAEQANRIVEAERKRLEVIMGAVSVFQDITLRKNMEQQKNEFLSLASHELRTPITSIQGLAEILHMHIRSGKSLDSSRSHHAIEEVIGQSRQLTYLIDGMLDISRLENMQLELQIVSHNIIAMLKRVVESQSMTVKHHVIRHVLQGVQAHETLMGCFDEPRMTQVINNLINNAVKYSPVGSPVEVGLRRDATQPDSILLWVKDVGVGIPQSELNSIFERFYRGSSVDRSIGGLGVGLYLVREIVMRHNGRIWAESVEGEGSTFYVLLPLSPSAD